jgi:hypothetical protein
MTAKPLYACIPRTVAKFPPIAHRGDTCEALLQPFEFAVLAGLLCGARAALGRQRHDASMKAGHVAVQKERQYAQQFKDAWDKHRASDEDMPAPMRRSILYVENPHKPRLRWGKRLVGRVATKGYQQKQQRLRKQAPPEIVKVTLTRYGLLRLAGLPKNGDYFRWLDAVLDRLCDHVGYRNEALASPPLVDWSSHDRKLELRVSGAWLAPPFVRVPMPLPLRGATGLALYLFLQISQDGGEIAFDTLRERLGMPACGGGAVASRALRNALKIVNAHLAAFTIEQCHALLAENIDLPEEYEIKSDDDGRLISFTAHRTLWPDDIDDGDGRFAFDGDPDEADIDADEANADEYIDNDADTDAEAITGGDIDTEDEVIERRLPKDWRKPVERASASADTDNEDDDDAKWGEYEYTDD